VTLASLQWESASQSDIPSRPAGTADDSTYAFARSQQPQMPFSAGTAALDVLLGMLFGWMNA